MILGYFFVRPIPLPSAIHNEYEEIDYAEAEAASLVPSVLHHENNSQTTLLDHDEELARGHHQDPTTPSEEYIPDARTAVELSPARSHAYRSRSRSHVRGGRSVSRTGKPLIEHGPNIFGKTLWTSIDFWILFVSLSLGERLLCRLSPQISLVCTLIVQFPCSEWYGSHVWVFSSISVRNSD